MWTRRSLRIAAAFVLVLVCVLIGIRQLARARTFQLFGTLVPSVATAERRVALSFDDGPSAGPLDTLLALLAARGVSATFFVIGHDLAALPDAGRRIVAAGHELGNHTYSHKRMIFVGPATIRSQLERTDSLIRAVGHQGPILFRPPYGQKLAVLPWYLSRTRRTTVTWDVEPDSYSEVAASADGIVRHVLDKARPGSIILLHVWYPSRATSLRAVGPLIDSLHARGYRVGSVRQLLAAQPDPSANR
jgi:peptidoglycan/xylan/chitin deacetylase (PgdA/CDA1 family)